MKLVLADKDVFSRKILITAILAQIFTVNIAVLAAVQIMDFFLINKILFFPLFLVLLVGIMPWLTCIFVLKVANSNSVIISNRIKIVYFYKNSFVGSAVAIAAGLGVIKIYSETLQLVRPDFFHAVVFPVVLAIIVGISAFSIPMYLTKRNVS